MLECSLAGCGYFACAQIATMQGRLEDALDEVDRSLIRKLA